MLSIRTVYMSLYQNISVYSGILMSVAIFRHVE